jgi:hypothetical protein
MVEKTRGRQHVLGASPFYEWPVKCAKALYNSSLGNIVNSTTPVPLAFMDVHSTSRRSDGPVWRDKSLRVWTAAMEKGAQCLNCMECILALH